EVTYSYNITKGQPYSEGYDKDAKNQTLFADYIFAQPQTMGAQEVNFTMVVTGVDNRVIREHDFNTQIPLQRNHLTTIIGNLLTTATEFNVSIDDNFNGETVIGINPDAPKLPTPEVNNDVDGNVVTLSWAAVEGTDYYTVAYDKNSATIATNATEVTKTTATSVTYTLDYATEYTFYITAYPKDLMAHAVSETQEINITTEYDQLVMSEVNAEVVDYKDVKLSWTKVENAASYAIEFNDETYTTTDLEYTFNLDYATEYTFAVTAVAEQGNGRYSDSEAVSVTVTTEKDLYVYFHMPEDMPEGTTVFTFTVNTWDNPFDYKVYSLTDDDNDGIYKIEKSKLKKNFNFTVKIDSIFGSWTYKSNDFNSDDYKNTNHYHATINYWYNTIEGEWKVK
ncbi:MAG: hypothetical protein II204_02665, partial [Alistipes sp.]|nr:hypothetical protein [Alistipes sp.]